MTQQFHFRVYISKTNKSTSEKDMGTPVFTADVRIAKIWKQCPYVDTWFLLLLGSARPHVALNIMHFAQEKKDEEKDKGGGIRATMKTCNKNSFQFIGKFQHCYSQLPQPPSSKLKWGGVTRWLSQVFWAPSEAARGLWKLVSSLGEYIIDHPK